MDSLGIKEDSRWTNEDLIFTTVDGIVWEWPGHGSSYVTRSVDGRFVRDSGYDEASESIEGLPCLDFSLGSCISTYCTLLAKE